MKQFETSGIYLLTFPSGDTYVGKSVNCWNRWDQHKRKLELGTAAKAMQEAVGNNPVGFQATLLQPTHPDLLDEYEGLWINKLNPTLNTQRPLPRADAELLWWWSEAGEATQPVSRLIQLAQEHSRLEHECEQLCEELEAAECELHEVQQRWDQVVWREACKLGVVQTQQAQLGVLRKQQHLLQQQLQAAESRLHQLTRMSWWQRVWWALRGGVV